MTKISCQAPGKLIISGEHAVVYGRPALAMAVNRHAVAGVCLNQSSEIVFSLPDFGARLSYTWEELMQLRVAKLAAYDEFLAGQREIAAVLPNPVELIPLAFAVGIEQNEMTDSGADIELSISIPIGCGMGSSSAVGLALIRAADLLVNGDQSADSLFEQSMVCERCMHGHPSGIDSYTCLHGGTVRFVGGNPEDCPTPSLPLSLLDTGRPESSTGECVVAVREKFGSSRIWDEFEQATNAIHNALSGDLADLLEPIRANHELLCRIGVVPDRIRDIVADIEKQGGAAKICGAGAVRGEHGGVVMVVGDIDMKDILKRYQVTALTCATDADGLTVL